MRTQDYSSRGQQKVGGHMSLESLWGWGGCCWHRTRLIGETWKRPLSCGGCSLDQVATAVSSWDSAAPHDTWEAAMQQCLSCVLASTACNQFAGSFLLNTIMMGNDAYMPHTWCIHASQRLLRSVLISLVAAKYGKNIFWRFLKPAYLVDTKFLKSDFYYDNFFFFLEK